jgi:hypothetical protein
VGRREQVSTPPALPKLRARSLCEWCVCVVAGKRCAPSVIIWTHRAFDCKLAQISAFCPSHHRTDGDIACRRGGIKSNGSSNSRPSLPCDARGP